MKLQKEIEIGVKIKSVKISRLKSALNVLQFHVDEIFQWSQFQWVGLPLHRYKGKYRNISQ